MKFVFDFHYRMAKHSRVTLVLLCMLLLLTRFVKLAEIPVALTHDEVIYLINAKAIAYTGKDISQTWNPWSLSPFHQDFSELPAVILALTVPWISDPMLGGKALHALVGCAIPLLFANLVKKFSGSRSIAFFSLLVASVNPWLWQLSRMAFDPLLSVFFYLLGATFLFGPKGIWRLLSIPFFTLGFFQYQGLKPILLPIVGLMLLLQRSNQWKSELIHSTRKTESLISVLVLCWLIGLMALYATFLLPRQSASNRLNQFRMPSSLSIIELVDEYRRVSLTHPLVPMFSNRYSVFAEETLRMTMRLFNPYFLFFHPEEAANPYAVYDHGLFYPLDLVLIVIGLVYLLKRLRSKRRAWLYGLLLLVSASPAIANNAASFMFRPSLFYISIIPLIATGLHALKKMGRWRFLVYGLYFISVVHFSFHYFIRYPVYGADGQFFSERTLASYLDRLPKNNKVTIYVPNKDYLLRYLYYQNRYTPANADAIAKSINSGSYTIDAITFVSKCEEIPQEPGLTLIVSREAERCEFVQTSAQKNKFKTVIPAVRDSGAVFTIFNDPVCTDYELSGFVHPQDLDSFNVNKLSNRDFCLTWIAQQ